MGGGDSLPSYRVLLSHLFSLDNSQDGVEYLVVDGEHLRTLCISYELCTFLGKHVTKKPRTSVL